MRKDVLVGALIASSCIAAPRHAPAGIVCPDSMYCTVSFTRTYTGSYRLGEPYDYVTIAPDGSGETFAATGITPLMVQNCTLRPRSTWMVRRSTPASSRWVAKQ